MSQNVSHKSLASTLAAGYVMFLTPLFVHAQAFDNPLAYDTLQDFLLAILNSVIYIVFPIIVLMIVYVGFKFVQAQGNAQKLQEAKRSLVFTVIGALVVLGSVALAIAIKETVDLMTAAAIMSS